MPIPFRSILSSATANATFLDKTIDDIKRGKLGLYKVEINEAGAVGDVQEYLNFQAIANGIAGENDPNATTYSSELIVNNGDDRKVAIGKLDAQLSNTDNRLQGIETSIGQPSGIAELDANGFVPSSQLPSFVDDVIEATDFVSLPIPTEAETGKIYVTLDDNRTYRWSGSVYIRISQSPVDSVNGQVGMVNITQTEVGLGNVVNEAQLNRLSGDFNSFPEKTILVNDDIILIEDSEDGLVKKKSTISQLLSGSSSLQVATLSDVKPFGTNGGVILGGAGTTTRTLNTLNDPDSILESLASNVFTFNQQGSYLIEVDAPAWSVNRHKAVLTSGDGTTIYAIGTSTFSDSQATGRSQESSTIYYVLNLADISLDFKIVHKAQSTNNLGGGISSNISLNGVQLDEVYTQVTITRLS